jgi:hypothetical protein
VLDQVLGAWLHTRSVQAGGRLVISVDGKAVRGAKGQAILGRHADYVMTVKGNMRESAARSPRRARRPSRSST